MQAIVSCNELVICKLHSFQKLPLSYHNLLSFQFWKFGCIFNSCYCCWCCWQFNFLSFGPVGSTSMPFSHTKLKPIFLLVFEHYSSLVTQILVFHVHTNCVFAQHLSKCTLVTYGDVIHTSTSQLFFHFSSHNMCVISCSITRAISAGQKSRIVVDLRWSLVIKRYHKIEQCSSCRESRGWFFFFFLSRVVHCVSYMPVLKFSIDQSEQECKNHSGSLRKKSESIPTCNVIYVKRSHCCLSWYDDGLVSWNHTMQVKWVVCQCVV